MGRRECSCRGINDLYLQYLSTENNYYIENNNKFLDLDPHGHGDTGATIKSTGPHNVFVTCQDSMEKALWHILKLNQLKYIYLVQVCYF